MMKWVYITETQTTYKWTSDFLASNSRSCHVIWLASLLFLSFLSSWHSKYIPYVNKFSYCLFPNSCSLCIFLHLFPSTEGVKIASHQQGLHEAQELLSLIYLAWFPLTVLVNQFEFDSKNNSVLRAPQPCLSVCNCYSSQWRGGRHLHCRLSWVGGP